MKLSRIAIKNFRSIKEATIVFDQNCLVLLGKNEAGKSNVLKAIAAIFGKYPIANKDKRKKIDNEKIEESYLRGVFKLDDNDIIEVANRFNSKFANTEIMVFQNKGTIKDYIKVAFNEFIIQLEVKEGSAPQFIYWEKEKNQFDLLTKLYIAGTELSKEANKTELNL